MMYQVTCVTDVYATSPVQAAKIMNHMMSKPGNVFPILHVKETKSGFEAVYDTSIEPPKQIA